MSSILRSSKFVRCFAGFARSLVVNSARFDVEGSLINNSLCSSTNFIRSLAVQAPNTQTQAGSTNLEKTLQQLDHDVRRTGRISRRDIEEVLEEIRQTRSATSSQSLLVIRCCGNLVPEELPEVRTQLVQEIWKTLEKLKVPMDISHYNALLRVYLENEHSFSPTEFLSDLEKKGVEPNRVTYQRLITRYCQHGDIEGATKILEYMREKNLPVNESVFNALIMGHSQAEDMESANGILSVMVQAGLEPSADTYTTLLSGYAKLGNMEKIRAILEECDKKDIYLLDKDHMDIIYALATNGHSQYVDEILPRMRKSAGYNQDAINLILRLVNKGLEDISMKVLYTMPKPLKSDGSQGIVGSFLIRHLLKANRPINKVIEICKQLESEGLNPRAMYIATETSMTVGNNEQTNELLKAMQQEEIPIRQHYFWPMICTAGKTQDDENVLQVVKTMTNEFNMVPTAETVRDYILPNLKMKNSDQIVGTLRGYGISSGITAVGLVYNLLLKNNITEAADVASKYRAYYSPNLIRRALVPAFNVKQDVESFVSVVHNVYDGLTIRDTLMEDMEGPSLSDGRELMGQYLVDVVSSLRGNKVELLKNLFQAFLEKGLAISDNCAEKIQSLISGEELSNEIASLLESLTAKDLTPAAIVKKSLSGYSYAQDEGTLLKKIKALDESGQSAVSLKRALYGNYCKNLDVEKAESLFKELETGAAPGLYAQILDLFVKKENLEKATEYLDKFRAHYKVSDLDLIKVVKYTELLVKNDKFEEALGILGEQSERTAREISFGLNTACFQILNHLAEKKQVEEVKIMFNALVDNRIVEISNVLLGPLIKVHLLRDDLPAALNEFEHCCLKYNSTPWKNELSCKLIQMEDATNLQKITDLSTKVHGEVNSLYDLVFSFVQCGRIRQARKILETPGLRTRTGRLNTMCEKYRQIGSVASLEGLVEATKDLNYIDRTDIFNNLLLSYVNANDTDKALGLWTQMQDEDVQPTDEFLFKLGEFLKANGKDVPFVVPAFVSKPLNETASSVQKDTPLVTADVKDFRNAMKVKDWNRAKLLASGLEAKGLAISTVDNGRLIEGLVQSNQLKDAGKRAIETWKRSERIDPRVAKFLLNRLAVDGDVDTLNEIGSLISSGEKKLVSYDNKLCHSYVVAGKAKEYLDSLENEIRNCKPEDVSALDEKFPRGGAFGILDSHPELLPKFEQIVALYHEKGIISPANTLWQYFFIIPELKEKADKLWDQYLQGTSRVMFQKVLSTSRQTANVNIAQNLVDHLTKHNHHATALGIAYSCLTDVLLTSNKVDEAMTTVSKGLEIISIEQFNHTALMRVKKAVENQGKVFPYTIPPKGTRQVADTSSSSSDDEATPVKSNQ